MNSKKHKLPKRLLAMLLTICMFITMAPTGAFAVESQETVDETVVIQNDTSEPTTEVEEDVSISTGDSEISEETETDGSETDTQTEPNIPTADDEAGDVAGEYTITPNMTQDEVNQAVAEATGPITVQAGDYGRDDHHIKITLEKGNQTVVLEAGDYTRLMIVVNTENNILTSNGAKINGDVDKEDIHNQNPCIFIPSGSLTVSGELTIYNHDYGVIMGYSNGSNHYSTGSAAFSLAENAVLNINDLDVMASFGIDSKGEIQNEIAYDQYTICQGKEYECAIDVNTDGTRGSAFSIKGEGKVKVNISQGAKLNVSDCYGSGFFAVNVKNFTLNILSQAVVNLGDPDGLPNGDGSYDGNGQGINMNTDYAESVNINVNDATLNIIGNRSNGITGQSYPYLLDIKNDSTVNVNNNGAIGINNFYIKLDNSDLSVSNNGSHGATNVAFDALNSAAKFNDNRYIGLNITKTSRDNDESATDLNHHSTINTSSIEANNNGGSGIRFFYGTGNGYGNITINDSNIMANGNGLKDVELGYGWNNNPDSPGNWAGIVGLGVVTLQNSFVYSASAGGYGLYNNSNGAAQLKISGTDVVAFDYQGRSGEEEQASMLDIADDWNSRGNTGRTYVMGGSLQANLQNMRIGTGIDTEINHLIPNIDNSVTDKSQMQYTAPINDNNTALTRFDLDSEVDKGTSLTANQVEEGAAQTYSFGVWDPNDKEPETSGESYTYTFRYNEAGEDLDEIASGNAYVWTPVTMIRYDATEGTIDSENLGTAQTKTDDKWLLVNERGDQSALNYNVEETYIDAVDYTICGNSLALSEGTLPTATKNDQTFAGWYYATGEKDISKAAEYAQKGDYTELYKLLLKNGKKFDANTLTSADLDNVEEITLYAVWTDTITITPADLTIYIAGEEGYEAVVGGEESPVEQTQNALPKPIFKLNVDTDNIKDGMVFTSSEGKSWIATHIEKVDGAESDDEYYSLEPAGAGQDEVRVTYTDSEGVSHISSEFDITEVDELYTEYDIQLYTNTVDINNVVARDSDGKLYSVMLGEPGTLTIRTVENTESDKTITPVTTQSPDSRMPERTGKIVVDEDTTYTVNDLGIPMPEGQDPSLLFDTIVTSDGEDRESALENKVAERVNTPNNRTRRYQSQYLDLVDADNGNIWLTASKPVTVYWAYPDGTDASDDFTLWHFEGLHRDNSDGGQSGFEIGDLEQATVENVRIDKGQYGISFTVEPGGFSPFVLTWTEGSGQPIDPGTDPDDPDTPALDKVNHFLYIEGYPEDYRTGEYSDNEDLWPVKPQGNITRAEVATIFYRLLKDEVREEIETDVNSFPDVNEDDWFNITVSSLANMGAISGYEDGTFRPNEPITRAELSAMAVRFLRGFDAGFCW